MKTQYFINMDEFNRTWIIENSLEEIQNYEKGVLTLRGLHYRLVARGMTNTLRHYKRVVQAMIEARWDDVVEFDVFSDHDRQMIGRTEYEETILENQVVNAKEAIDSWMNYYNKNRWENQNYYPEVWIEKKALQGVFGPICEEHNVTLGACKGYPSLTFVNKASSRFWTAEDNRKKPIILYFGDYDPSGEDIPRSIKANLNRMGIDIEVRRIALMEEQVIEWDLPPAPVKSGDSRSGKWKGLGQVELDAIDPNNLNELCDTALRNIFDYAAQLDLLQQEREEKEEYVKQLKLHVKTL